MPAPQYHFDLCGWHVASAIAIPDLGAWAGGEGQPDITIAFGNVPSALESPVLETPSMQIDAAGRARIHIAGIADYLVEEGNRITIASALSPEAPEIRLFLLGTAFGILCHQRGILPLHAATVEIDDEAVILAAPSGFGKSTLAAAFWRRGFRLVGDDVAPLAVSDGGAMVLPGVRRVRLWRDSIEAADGNPGEMERCRQGIDKFSRSLDTGIVPSPIAVRALVHLRLQFKNAGDSRFERLHGKEAYEAFQREIYRRRSFVALAGKKDFLSQSIAATASIPFHFRFVRALQYETLDATVDAIVDTIRSAR